LFGLFLAQGPAASIICAMFRLILAQGPAASIICAMFRLILAQGPAASIICAMFRLILAQGLSLKAYRWIKSRFPESDSSAPIHNCSLPCRPS
jgi:hypothetical protein